MSKFWIWLLDAILGKPPQTEHKLTYVDEHVSPSCSIVVSEQSQPKPIRAKKAPVKNAAKKQSKPKVATTKEVKATKAAPKKTSVKKAPVKNPTATVAKTKPKR